VTPIRPSAFPAPPANATGADAARAAAQRAFFAAAMGRPAATAAPTSPSATAPAAARSPAFAPVQRAEIRTDPGAEPPARILRPGSLLDIKV
jgi:hypothetical protein